MNFDRLMINPSKNQLAATRKGFSISTIMPQTASQKNQIIPHRLVEAGPDHMEGNPQPPGWKLLSQSSQEKAKPKKAHHIWSKEFRKGSIIKWIIAISPIVLKKYKKIKIVESILGQIVQITMRLSKPPAWKRLKITSLRWLLKNCNKSNKGLWGAIQHNPNNRKYRTERILRRRMSQDKSY